MAEPWVFLLTGGALVLLGFVAAQVFDKARFPDYFILMAVGLILGSGLIPLPVDPRASLATIAPVLSAVAIAFILFEGGLVLHVRGLGKVWAAAGGHTVVAMALSIAGVWVAGTYLLRLAPTTSLILALAFCGPSASIDMSMLSQLKVQERTRFTIVVEGVMGNVVAAVFVLLFINVSGLTTDEPSLLLYLVYLAGAILLALLVGLGWTRLVGGTPRRFSFMTSVAIAVILYAVGEGFLGGNGGIAAFVFGLVLGHRRFLTASKPAPAGAAGPRGLQEFHGELVFLLRSFFFLYLGLRVTLAEISTPAAIGAAAFLAVFVASRWPSSFALSRAWRLPPLDRRILRGTVSRGMTDTVLILFAIEVLYIPPWEAPLVTNLLFLVIIAAALASAVMVFRAERLAKRAPAAPPAPVLAPAVIAEGLRDATSALPRDLDHSLGEFLEDPIVQRGEID
jgi:cell volume regulation protein A